MARGGASPRRIQEEPGAVAVETAVVSLILCILLFGVVEFGLLISSALDLSTGARAGARVGATAGGSQTSDYAILEATKGAGGSLSLSDVERVVVFRSTDPSGQPTPECAGGQPTAGVCNVYDPADLALSEEALAATGHSDFWPPASRVGGSEYVGVFVRAKHHWLTQFFPFGPDEIADKAVMLIEDVPLPTTTVPISVTQTTSVATTRPPTTRGPTSSRPPTTRGPTITRPPTTRPSTTTNTTRPSF